MTGTTVSNRDQHVNPNPTGRDRTAVATYIAAAVTLGVLLASQAWQGGLGSDAFAHLAVLRELSTRPLDPLNPYVSSADPAHYFSPYSVGLGLIGWATGAAPLVLLRLGAALNVALIATGLWLFVRSFSPYRWAPHLALFFTLVAWGIGSWRWSGFLNLNSIGFGIGYPSMFATGIGLIALAALCRYCSTRRPALLVLLGIAAAVIALTHLFTTLWVGIAAIAIVAAQPSKVIRRTAVGLLGAALLAAVLVLMWPYWSILELATAASGRSDVHDVLYDGVLERGFLLIPAVVAIGYRARTNPRDPLVLMFAASVAVYVLGYMTDSHGLGRVIPLIALSAHVALADMIAGWLQNGRTRRIAIYAIGVIGVVGIFGSLTGLAWMVPGSLAPGWLAPDADRLTGNVSSYQPIEETISDTDIAIASPWMNKVVPSIAGRVVVPGHLTPLLSDREERERASQTFFDASLSTQERAAVAAAWGITHIVVEPADMALHPWLERDYVVIAESEAFTILVIASAVD